jgi:hypothetical protein
LFVTVPGLGEGSASGTAAAAAEDVPPDGAIVPIRVVTPAAMTAATRPRRVWGLI